MSRRSLPPTRDKIIYPSQLPDPFQEWQAERESRLTEYFVQGPHHIDVFRNPEHPQSCFVFAAPGGGKTTYRLMLEKEYRPEHRASAILAASLFYPQTVRAELGGDLDRGTLDHHLRLLIKSVLSALLQDFLVNAAPFFALTPLRRSALIGLARTYVPELANPLALSDQLRGWGYGEFTDLVEREQAADAPTEETRWNMLHAFRSEPVRSPSGEPIDHLQLLTGMLERCGFVKACVFIDDLDQLIPLGKTEEATAFLLPLAKHLPNLENLPVTFKFFLPIELATGLLEHGVRFDRYPRYDLEWTDEMLKELLSNRLKMVSDGKIVSLGELAEEEIGSKGSSAKPTGKPADSHSDQAPLPKRLDDEIVRKASGSPRQLLMLGNLLFAACRQRPGKDKLFIEEDLEWALTTFEKRHGALAPFLRLDEKQGRAYVGSRELPLSKTEFKCLLILKRAQGEPQSKEAVWGQLYPNENFSDQQVHTFFSRLRKKFERDPKNPVYLKTERDVGYYLEMNLVRDV